MAPRAPAEIGIPVEDVETPALLIIAEALERNLARMADFARAARIGLRAHAKAHKSPVIARQQMALGAVGLCCQTVGEAEAMVAGGCRDLLISNQIVSAARIERLARLAQTARVIVCVDDAGNVGQLSAAAVRYGVSLEVLVEINVGANRCGVPPGEPAVELARVVAAAPGLKFAGLQAYNGFAQHVRDHHQRRMATESVIQLCRTTRDAIAAAGLTCRMICGGGTGSFAFEAASGLYTELQPGTYAFMDATYSQLRDANGSAFAEFEQSLFVLTTVISHTTAPTAVVDAGLKTIAVDTGLPVVADLAGAVYARAGDEHGTLDLHSCLQPVKVGDKVRLIPGNCDPTVNLHDYFVVVRNSRVQALWPICARGADH